MTGRKRFCSYVYAKEKVFLPEDAVNIPRNDEDARKCCYARIRSERRRHVIEGSLPRNWRM